MKIISLLSSLLICIISFNNGIAQFRLSEDFSSATFPPPGWTRGPNFSDGVFAPIQPQWERRVASAYGVGTGSAQVFFFDISFEPIDSLTSPVFVPTIPNDSIYFDHAYRTTTPFQAVDELRIYTSDNGGMSFTLFQTLNGGEGGELVTEPPNNEDFENPSAWASKKYPLPTGVNKIRFESFSANGNNLFVDNIKVGKPLIVVPVTLLNFSGSRGGNNINLKWTLTNVINNLGFEIEKLIGTSWQKIGFIKSRGNSNLTTEYTFGDQYPADGYNYYRLKQIDLDGVQKYSNIIKIEFSIDKNGYVFQNYPNPFTASTLIRYHVTSNAHVAISVYDINGKQVATLVNATKAKGNYDVTWNAGAFPAGTYFCKAIIGSEVYTRSMIKVK